jgi:RNA 3'-terminal phosphate cyclase (ATP)
MGINFSIKSLKRGYYPKGNGEVKIQVYPSKVKPISLTERKTKNLKLFCSFSRLSPEIIHEKIERIKSKLIDEKFTVESIIKKEDAVDSGSSILITHVDDSSIIGIDCIYDKKTNEFNLDLSGIIENNMGVDENLADMLVLPASLSDSMTVFRVPKISKHLETNLFVTSKITGCRYGVGKLQNGYEVRIEGISNSSIQQ